MATLAPRPLFGDLSRNWKWLLVVGILSVILGVIGLGMTFLLTLASVLYFGVLMLVAGGVQLFQAVKCSGWKSVVAHVLIGLLYALSGLMIVTRPLLASVVLTGTLAFMLLLIGVLRCVMAMQHRAMQNWGWALVGGIVTVGLGLMILAKWPLDALWVIGLFLAIELIVNGWSLVFIAVAARTASAGPAPGRADAAARS
jgi:uncharacterized membrane protein HdeD (DUF308 family)